MSIETEFQEITKVKPEPGEGEQEYRVRLLTAAANIFDADDKKPGHKDETWLKLSDPAQEWFNYASPLMAGGQEVPHFDVKIPKEPESLQAPEPYAAGEEVAEEAPAKPRRKKKRMAKKKPKVIKKKKKLVRKTKAKVAKRAATNGSGRGRKGTFPLTAKIKFLVDENPHRAGSKLHAYFNLYENGMTVEEALKAGVVWENLRYLTEQGIIQIR